jgi:hypothetical protein
MLGSSGTAIRATRAGRVAKRPKRSTRHTNTTSICRRRRLHSTFSGLSTCRSGVPPRTCVVMVQPRQAAYSRLAALHAQRLLIVGGETDVQSTRNIFDRFRAWPKTLPDFVFWEAPFSGHFSMSPNPGQAGLIILRGSGPCRPRQRLAIVPGHPLRWVGCQLLGVPLQLGEVMERIGCIYYSSQVWIRLMNRSPTSRASRLRAVSKWPGLAGDQKPCGQDGG